MAYTLSLHKIAVKVIEGVHVDNLGTVVCSGRELELVWMRSRYAVLSMQSLAVSFDRHFP